MLGCVHWSDGNYLWCFHVIQTRPAPILTITRITPGAGIVVLDTGTVGWVVGRVVVGGGLVTNTVIWEVTEVVTGRVTGTLVVTVEGDVICIGTLVAGVNDEVIRGFTLWINRLPGGVTGVIVFSGTL